MSTEPPGRMQIGRVLRDARERGGLEIHDVAERTKIRTVYLRALEDEEWAALPGPAYAKGFLRTYAGLLGLDAEALVDEFRRQVEGGGESPTYPLGEGVLERGHRPWVRSRRPGWGVAIVVAAVIVAGVLALIGVFGDDEEPRGERRPAAKQGDSRAEGRGDAKRSGGGEASEPVTLTLTVAKAAEICLLDDSKRELIDGQVLAAGSEESFTARGFELRFPRGYARASIDLALDGKSHRLPRVEGPAAFELTARGRPERARRPGLGCP